MISLVIDVQIDDSRLVEVGRQVPFAMAKAMNNAMVSAQTRVRGRMRSIYTIRRVRFLELSTKITAFAKKDSLVSELAIAPPGGREDIFGKFEIGGVKRPLRGRDLAVPVTGSPVKRTRQTVIRAENRPRVLLAETPGDPHNEGAFLRRDPGGRGGVIFIRKGRHLVLAYRLEPEAPIDASLKFEDTAAREFIKDFPTEFLNQLARAVATSK